MIVTCERCATQFQLDDSRVPSRGVRVRCSRCKNSFRVMPEGLAAPDEVASPARRAHGEETTQDIPEERSGSGPERRAAGGRAAPRAVQAKEAESDATPGSDAEESDWEFNNNTTGDFDRGARKGSDAEDAKPEMPEVAPARGRLADDWFGGGAGDVALELEDRSSAAQPAPAAPASPPLRTQPAAAVVQRAPLPPVPAREPAPAPPREVAPPAPALAREPEPEPEPGFDLDLASALETPKSRETAPAEPQSERIERMERMERRAEQDAADELGKHTWGDLLAAAEVELPAPRKTASAPALRSKATQQLSAWLGRFGHALGAGLTLGLFCVGLYAGLVPHQQIAPTPKLVAGLELDSVEVRYVENVSAGTLFVVSGRVRNPGATGVSIGRLALELLDAQGHALGGAMLHAPAPIALLREAPADSLTQLPRLSGEVRPGEVRSFEALVTSLPAQAREYRIVESQTPPPEAQAAP